MFDLRRNITTTTTTTKTKGIFLQDKKVRNLETYFFLILISIFVVERCNKTFFLLFDNFNYTFEVWIWAENKKKGSLSLN